MANQYDQQGLTGKYPRPMENTVAGNLVAPVVAKQDLMDKSHVINDTTKSGKQLGAVVICLDDEAHSFAIAEGSKPEDKWHIVATDATSQITPAQ